MAKQEWKWVRVKALSDNDKADIATACERFIAETLKPRLLPEIRPTKFNYPLDIFGRWRGSKYSFRESHQEAARLLARIGGLRGAAEQAIYVESLKTRCGRKRNFMKLLG